MAIPSSGIKRPLSFDRRPGMHPNTAHARNRCLIKLLLTLGFWCVATSTCANQSGSAHRRRCPERYPHDDVRHESRTAFGSYNRSCRIVLSAPLASTHWSTTEWHRASSVAKKQASARLACFVLQRHDGLADQPTRHERFTSSTAATRRYRPSPAYRLPANCPQRRRGRLRYSRNSARWHPSPASSPSSCAHGPDARGRPWWRW
jgi:hypothetical protein